MPSKVRMQKDHLIATCMRVYMCYLSHGVVGLLLSGWVRVGIVFVCRSHANNVVDGLSRRKERSITYADHAIMYVVMVPLHQQQQLLPPPLLLLIRCSITSSPPTPICPSMSEQRSLLYPKWASIVLLSHSKYLVA